VTAFLKMTYRKLVRKSFFLNEIPTLTNDSLQKWTFAKPT